MIRKFYRKHREALIKALANISPLLMNKWLYFESFKRFPNLKNPVSFSEKMNYLAVSDFYNSEIVRDCADKYSVRKYISKCGLDSILIPLVGVWDDPKDIVWDNLPNKFVLKGNHGSGLNLLCWDKNQLDIDSTINTLYSWLKRDYWQRSGELFYKNIKRRIIAETFIETADGFPPRDYKFFCNYGDVKFLFVAQERINGNVKFDYLTPQWKRIPVKASEHPQYEGEIIKPDNLEDMLKIASILSKEFPMVRVDLYSESGRIYFGELTFLDHAGHPHFTPAEYDIIFGEMFTI